VANGGIDGLNGLTASEETFADRRHTVASLMLMAGANPKVVSKALGHSPVGFTRDTYGHLLPTTQKRAMAKLDRLLVPTMSQNENVSNS
jgi:integrase